MSLPLIDVASSSVSFGLGDRRVFSIACSEVGDGVVWTA